MSWWNKIKFLFINYLHRFRTFSFRKFLYFNFWGCFCKCILAEELLKLLLKVYLSSIQDIVNYLFILFKLRFFINGWFAKRKLIWHFIWNYRFRLERLSWSLFCLFYCDTSLLSLWNSDWLYWRKLKGQTCFDFSGWCINYFWWLTLTEKIASKKNLLLAFKIGCKFSKKIIIMFRKHFYKAILLHKLWVADIFIEVLCNSLTKLLQG